MVAAETPERRVEIMACIRHWLKIEGVAPTIREIADELDISRATVVHHIDRLIADGQLKRHPGRARGLVIVERKKVGQ